MDMNLTVTKTLTLSGQVVPPSSKSQSIRGLFFALLAEGESILENILDSDDMQCAIDICKHLGAQITVRDHQMVIHSQGLPLYSDVNMLNSGNSGITTRFVMPMLGFRRNPQDSIVLDCGDQMRARPTRPLVDALKNLGLNIQYLENVGTCPVAISGNLLGGVTEVEGISSQYLSALLISLPCAPNDSEIRVQDLHERPYVDMTLNWLQEQKISYTHHVEKNTDIYKIKGKQRYKKFHKKIAGDFSSASYLIAAAVLTKSHVELRGLDMQDPQGDKRLVNILQAMGADIAVKSDRLIIRGGNNLTGIKIDANDIPDLLPTLAVVGTAAQGKTKIINVRQARIKETDRIHSMTEGLSRLGAHVEEYEEGMTIYQSQLIGNYVQGFDDHRTVMALALAGMLAEGETRIDNAEAINKTFPTFIEIMKSLGAKMALFSE